ncbi:MAG: hypothetical protein DRP68_01940 [Candidatus Omnitrophota bacterium]|nr:MAG: hypothetical protein DRP68_01940 [Candidatus Omnitrophota bacterium]
MRIFGIILVFIYSICFAQEKERLIEYDFGEISQECVVKHKFQIEKRIKNGVALCECVQVKVYKEKQNLKNSFYTVEIEFNPQGYKGDTIQDVLRVDEENNWIRLRIKAFVKSK